MPGTVFINYRKDDSNWNAVALFNELQKYFPRESIFKDSINIDGGTLYKDEINKALQHCDVLLVIIGRQWLSIQDKAGKTRLSNPSDVLRLEIATALQRNIRVIPVLFDDTPMPEETSLPENLQPLCQRQFVSINSNKFESDVKQLADTIRKVLDSLKKREVPPPPGTPKKKRYSYIWVLAGIVLLIIIIAVISNQQTGGSDNGRYSPNDPAEVQPDNANDNTIKH